MEIRFAPSVAVHTPILGSDHLSNIIKGSICTNKSCNNENQEFSVKRTKCSSIIKNVIAASLKEELIEDLKDQPYSVLIDEWSDIRVKPHLGVVIM